MKIDLEKYNDLEFLKEVAEDKEKLRAISFYDNGYIFRQLKENGIFPEKEIVKSVPSASAIAFLFNHYDVTEAEKSYYSTFFKDSSKIMEFVNKDMGVSKNTVIEILSHNRKQFTAPDYFLNYDDLVENAEKFVRVEMNEQKRKFMMASINQLNDKELLSLPDAYFKRFQGIYELKANLLINSDHHRALFESVVQEAAPGVVSEYIKKTGNVSAVSLLSRNNQNEFVLTNILNIAKKHNPEITSNDFYPYLSVSGRYVVLSDFAGDLDALHFSKRYMENINLLREDLEYKVDESKLPVSLRNFIKLNNFTSSNRKEFEFTDDILEQLLPFVDGDLSKNVNLAKVDSLVWMLNDVVRQSDFNSIKEQKGSGVPLLDRSKVEDVVVRVFSKIFSDENFKKIYIPEELGVLINKIVPDSFNKQFTLLNTFSKKEPEYKEILKKIPKDILPDLKKMLAGKAIDFNSPLLEKSIFRMEEEDGKKVITADLNYVLPDTQIQKLLDVGISLSENLFKDDLDDFSSSSTFSDWKLKIIQNYKKYPDNQILQDLVVEMKKSHIKATEIFGSVSNTNQILSNVLLAITNIQDFDKKNPGYRQSLLKASDDDFYYEDEDETPTDKAYNKLSNALKKAQTELKTVPAKDIDSLVKTLKPKHFLDAKLIYGAFNLDNKLDELIVSSLNSGDTSIIDMDRKIIEKVKDELWGNLNNEGKENFFKAAIHKVSGGNFYKLMSLVNFNNPSNDLEKELKGYTIKNFPTEILRDKYQVDDVWEFNIQDLKSMFETIDKNSDWNFKRDTNTRFFDIVQFAFNNSTDEMILSTLDSAKENPAVYLMLQNPIAFNNLVGDEGKSKLKAQFIDSREKFFRENPDMEFEIDYKGEKVRDRFSAYRYFYDQLDIDVMVKGIGKITSSFAQGNANDYIDSSHSLRSIGDSWVVEFFPQLTYLYGYNYEKSLTGLDLKKSLYMSPEDIVSLSEKIIESDVGNVHLLLRYGVFRHLMGDEKLIEAVVENTKTPDDINKVLLGKLSGVEYIDKRGNTYFTQECCPLIDKGHWSNPTVNVNLYPDILESIARASSDNATYVGYCLNLHKMIDESFESFGSSRLMSSGKTGYLCDVAQYSKLDVEGYASSLKAKQDLDKKLSQIIESDDYVDNSMNTGFKL